MARVNAVSGVLLGDGPKGTALQAAGLPLGTAPEKWNLERPEAVRAVHAAHAAAGAAWVVANTFGANRGRLALAGLQSRVSEVNRAAVACAREGAPGLAVLGSLGPTGLDRTAGAAAYLEQVDALAGAGVDGFLIETTVGLEEGLAAVRAAAGSGRPVWASYTPGEDGLLLDGTTAADFAEAVVRAGAEVVGVNCGAGPESLMGPASQLVRTGLAPVYAAPSAGLPWIEAGRVAYPVGPEGFSQAAVELADRGARLVAGCCGVGPQHLEAAARRLCLTVPRPPEG